MSEIFNRPDAFQKSDIDNIFSQNPQLSSVLSANNTPIKHIKPQQDSLMFFTDQKKKSM